MRTSLQSIAASLTLIFVISACASPTGVGTTQPSSSDQVATIVAATMQALSTNTPADITPEVPAELLPHTLYYLNYGQVFRMERDGKTVTQLTFEDSDVTDYDVSPEDGTLAFVTGNQLLLMDYDGSNRRMLVDGGPRDKNNPRFFTDPLSNPVFSPDGQTIANGHMHQGLNLFDVTTGVSKLVIEDHMFGLSPVSYSPDGTKLLLAMGQWETPAAHAVYYPDTNVLVRYVEAQDYINCCSYHGGPAWSPDSSSFYGVASIHDTGYQ